jgi:tRNA(Arg) A34 adenosine deaminase TadA
MCASAASLFRVRKIVFGAYDPKGGGVEHGPRIFAAPGCLHVPEAVGGVRETESAALLKAFFRARRNSAENTKELLRLPRNQDPGQGH